MVGGKTNSAAFVGATISTVIGATISTVRSPILVVWWSETSIWQRWYGGRQDQSSGVRQSHYFGGSAIGPPPQVTPLAEPPVLVVYLIYKFKLKSMTIMKNNKKIDEE